MNVKAVSAPKKPKSGNFAEGAATPAYEEVDIFAGMKPTLDARIKRKRKSTTAAAVVSSQPKTPSNYLQYCLPQHICVGVL
jgi:hypothetical protein